MSLLIKNAHIIGAADDYTGDIFIQGESIAAVGKNLDVKADQEIDATGLLAFPGCIDPHVHLEMPFMGTFSSDNYETGTRAALYGGTTTVIDFILQKQGNSLYDAFNEWQGRSNGNACCDYSFHMAVTDFNEETKKEIALMVNEEGITSFKTFMAYKGALMIDDRQMVGLMNEVKGTGRDGYGACHQRRHDRLFNCKEQGRRKQGAAVSLFIPAGDHGSGSLGTFCFHSRLHGLPGLYCTHDLRRRIECSA